MECNDPWGMRKTDNQRAYKGQEKFHGLLFHADVETHEL